MGKLNNPKFVQMPLGKLKYRLSQLCNLHGIKFTETEEPYSSKASFLDGDSLPRYGKKPPEWKASGKRIKRGLYRSADGTVINADLIPIHYEGTLKYRVKVEEIQYGEQTSGTNPGNG